MKPPHQILRPTSIQTDPRAGHRNCSLNCRTLSQGRQTPSFIVCSKQHLPKTVLMPSPVLTSQRCRIPASLTQSALSHLSKLSGFSSGSSSRGSSSHSSTQCFSPQQLPTDWHPHRPWLAAADGGSRVHIMDMAVAEAAPTNGRSKPAEVSTPRLVLQHALQPQVSRCRFTRCPHVQDCSLPSKCPC